MNKPLTEQRSKDADVFSCFYTTELTLNRAFYDREREKEREREDRDRERESDSHLFRPADHRRMIPAASCHEHLLPRNNQGRKESHRSNGTGTSHPPCVRDKCQGHQRSRARPLCQRREDHR